MTKVFATAGVLLVLVLPQAASGTAAAATGGETVGGTSVPVSGGYAGWALDGLPGASAQAPAVPGSGGRVWFPVAEGSVDPRTGNADIGFAGTLRAAPADAAAAPLEIGGLRLELRDGTGTLYARVDTGGDAAQEGVALAEIDAGGAAPLVRANAVTWSGLRATLTEDGAGLLGGPADPAALDVTVGTGTGAAPSPPQDEGGEGDGAEGTAPSAPAPSTQAPSPDTSGGRAAPAARAVHAAVAPGSVQEVAGEGFAPGEIVLIAIDDDTRYQATADASGRVAQRFPVYGTAEPGPHAITLRTVTDDRRADAEFTVVPPE